MESLICIGTMFLFGLGIVLMIAGALEDSKWPWRLGVVILLVGTILFGLFLFASAKVEKQTWDRADEPYVTHSIIALSDGNEIDGKFRGGRYCMSGYINEKFTYVYGYETYGGGMKIQKADADISVVYLRDDVDPCAKWYTETKTFWWCERERATCDIYVPTDSMQASIAIDLE